MSWTPGFAVPSPNPADDVDQAGNPEGIDHDAFVTQDEFDEQGPSGRELAFASSTVSQTAIAGTAVDLTGLSVTFTVADRPVYVELDLPWVTASAATGTASAVIADGVGAVVRYGSRSFAASQVHSMRVVERISTPGEYTRKAQLQRAAGTATFNNNLNLATIVSTLSVIER